MAAEKYASGRSAKSAGPSVDFLAFHRRTATSLRRRAAEPGAKERAVRAVRALAKGPGALAPTRSIAIRVLQMDKRAEPRQHRSAVPGGHGIVAALALALAIMWPALCDA